MQFPTNCRPSAVHSLLLGGLLLISIVATVPAQQKKVSLDEVKIRLDKARSPVDRTRVYIQLSDALLSEARESITHDDALGVWLEQYRDAISLARETMVSSGRDAQKDPEGYKDLEIRLRHHINSLSGWKRKVRDSKPIEDSLQVAVVIRKEMLDLLFPVIGDKPKP